MTNSKTTKKALLTSALAVFMCVAMLIGTTFAWFTDSASTAVNKIQAGTLDIQLLDKDGNSLEGKTLEFTKAEDAPEGEAVLWEPGCTYNLPVIQVKNGGNLALKFKIAITGINGDAKLNEAIEWTISGLDTSTEYHLLPGASSELLTISGHMKEEAGNEYQGLSIDGVAITVYATQDTVEYDSNDNQYDANAEYNEDAWTGDIGELPEADTDGVITISTPEELAAFADQVNNHHVSFGGQTVKLANDIDMNNLTWLPIGQNFGANTVEFHGVFDGNGKTISNLKIAGLGEDAAAALTTDEQQVYSVGFFGYLMGTVKNLTIKNVEVVGYHNTGVIAGYGDAGAKVENCHVEDAKVTVTHLTDDLCGDKVGGIIGFINDSVSGAEVKDCSVKDSKINAGRDAGQVIGCAQEGSNYENCTATNVTVAATDGCSGANITNDIIGRDLR